ncbi:hypothetical protein U1Q18_015497 [Sarracenia purpurea var. burkii]
MENASRKTKRKREEVKVVYISSPVKVTACVSSFRALVQKLTGRNSDLSRLVQTDCDCDYDSKTSLDQGSRGTNGRRSEPRRESPASSESLFEHSGGALIASSAEEGFLGMFPPSFPFEACEKDVFLEDSMYPHSFVDLMY